MILPRPTSKRALISWALYDWGSGAYSVLIQTFVFATYFVQQVAANKEEGVAQWGITIGLVGFLIAIGGPFVGALADRGGHRKVWLAICTLLCAGSTFLCWYVYPSPSNVPFALLLISVGTIGSEFAYVFYNAMLPELAPPSKIGRWSGWGWGMGYAGGTLSLIIALFAFTLPGRAWFPLDTASAEDVRATFVLAGLWITIFSLPVLLFTPADPPPEATLLSAVRRSFSDLRSSLALLCRHKGILRFFVARMFYTDGLTTLFSFGGIYAAARFNFTETEILLFGIALNVTAGIGAAIFAVLDDFWGSREIIITSLIALLLLSAFALSTSLESHFWACGLSLGVFVGPIQASSRSYLARRAPLHIRNQLFGFFTLSGKATAFLGPTCVGWVTYWTGNLALGMSIILVFYSIGLLLMASLPQDEKIA